MRILQHLLIPAGILFLLGTSKLSAQDTSYNKRSDRKIKAFQRTLIINSDSASVFEFMDNIENTGSHMTKKSGAMGGGKLTLEWLSPNKTGLGTKYRWRGKAVGMKMDFTVEVSEWEKNKRKVWGTVGEAKMIVITWFEMYLEITPLKDGKTEVKLGIYYTKSPGALGAVFGKSYAKWCVNSMLRDTQKHFNTRK